ncbi:MAG: DUF3800 domain-containing protein [Phycisphaerae bacterium]
MAREFNIYCDESCHLENDGLKAMALGAVCCPLEKTRNIANKIRQLKIKHHLSKKFEVKWTKVSPAKIAFYADLIEYFFNEDNLTFRVLVVPDKSKLQHSLHCQTHDEWYYKMYFSLLKVILEPHSKYRIYLDIKDTHGKTKVDKLQEVICNSLYDFNREIVEKIQPVHSHEVEQIQLTDLLTAAVVYANRELDTSPAKTILVNLIKKRSGYSLLQNTLLREKKFNIFVWQAQGEINE